MHSQRVDCLLLAIMLLFSLELAPALFGTLYAAGLRNTDVPTTSFWALICLAPLVLLIYGSVRLTTRAHTVVFAGLALLCRAVLPNLNFNLSAALAVSAVGTGSMLLFFSAWFA